MIKSRRNKIFLIILLLIGVSLANYFAISALKENINLFYTPTQVKNNDVNLESTIRVGGIVIKDSIKRTEDLKVSFKITDNVSNLYIFYKGILPDLFKEGQGVVIKGKLNEKGEFIAEQILAKHDENYMPPEISYLNKK